MKDSRDHDCTRKSHRYRQPNRKGIVKKGQFLTYIGPIVLNSQMFLMSIEKIVMRALPSQEKAPFVLSRMPLKNCQKYFIRSDQASYLEVIPF